jgi:antitoxin component of MazEF toxin-antitoxin module
VIELKVIAIGDSLGILLPEVVLTHLNMRVGDFLLLTETADGFELTRPDPEFEGVEE